MGASLKSFVVLLGILLINGFLCEDMAAPDGDVVRCLRSSLPFNVKQKECSKLCHVSNPAHRSECERLIAPALDRAYHLENSYNTNHNFLAKISSTMMIATALYVLLPAELWRVKEFVKKSLSYAFCNNIIAGKSLSEIDILLHYGPVSEKCLMSLQLSDSDSKRLLIVLPHRLPSSDNWCDNEDTLLLAFMRDEILDFIILPSEPENLLESSPAQQNVFRLRGSELQNRASYNSRYIDFRQFLLNLQTGQYPAIYIWQDSVENNAENKGCWSKMEGVTLTSLVHIIVNSNNLRSHE